MEASNWFVLKILFGGIAAALFFLAALFGFLEYLFKDKAGKIIAWFRSKWIGIKASKWLSLPEKMIEWFLRLKEIGKNILPSNYSRSIWLNGLLVVLVIVFFALLYQRSDFFGVSLLMAMLLIMYFFLLKVPFISFVYMATTWSVIISLAAYYFGFFIEPLAPFWSGSLQILIPNILFDSLTIYFTFLLLSWALKKRFMLRIMIAVTADLVLAVLFACASLYFCLLYTDLEISFIQTFNVLLAKNAAGARYELGPYFWLMHTTFIPTLLYCSLVLVAWLAKLILKPVEWFFGAGQADKNPLKLTALLCTLIGFFFALLAFGADTAEKITQKDKPKTTSSQKSSFSGSQIYSTTSSFLSSRILTSERL